MLNVNNKALHKHTERLEQIHRSTLPVAIRGALNSAAFNVKTKTMPAEAKKAFVERKPTFLKANSKVEQAKGFDIKSMKATVGFVPKSKAVEELEQQEHGGTIGGRAFIPLKHARSGKSWDKMVRAQFRMHAIANKITDSKNAKGLSNKQRFVKSAIHAGKGGFVIGNSRTGTGRTLHYINSVKRGKDGNTLIKTTPIYSVKSGRDVKPKATHFMKTASNRSAKNMESFYIEQAKKQIAKVR